MCCRFGVYGGYRLGYDLVTGDLWCIVGWLVWVCLLLLYCLVCGFGLLYLWVAGVLRDFGCLT